MTRRYTGGFLSAKEQATDANTANGIFSVQDAAAATAAGSFPTGRWTPQRSLRFRAANQNYLNRTFGTPTNNKVWTWSAWIKRGSLTLADADHLFFASPTDVGANPSTYSRLVFETDGTLRLQSNASASELFTSSGLFRDPTAWYHIVLYMDAVNTTVRCYVNGTEITYASKTNPTNTNTAINGSGNHHRMGFFRTAEPRPMDGYMADVNFVDGQALTPSAFGFTDPETGTWVPKRYTGTYGNNGFYLDFRDNTSSTATTLGADRSGNSNNWTPNNFSVSGATATTVSFTSVGTTSWTVPPGITSVNYLVVAGGGAGGSAGPTMYDGGAAGGGAGGMLYGTMAVTPGTVYSIYVGAGASGAANRTRGASGDNSVLSSSSTSITAIGGGGGGGGANTTSGANGGSGGGGANGGAAGLGTAGQGNNGGYYVGSPGNGGGGAGSVGGSASSNVGANGGTGLQWPVNSTTYAGGGGGGGYQLGGGSGGSSIGGNGGSNNSNGSNASASTGSGGGGSGGTYNTTGTLTGGSGANGIIIVSYATIDSTYDSMVDVPGIAAVTSQPDWGGVQRGNYAVLSPLSAYNFGGTLSNGNLSVSYGDIANNRPTMAVSSGKWYSEITCTSAGGYSGTGLGITVNGPDVNASDTFMAAWYYNNGQTYNYSTDSYTSYGASWGTGDVIGVAWDCDNRTVTFYKNGVSQGLLSAGVMYVNEKGIGTGCAPFPTVYGTGVTTTFTANYGQRPFAYFPPAGFKSLCSTNLPNPVIKRPSDHFDVKTYTGNGSNLTVGTTAKQTSAFSTSSLEFKSEQTSYLTRTLTTPTSAKAWTFSAWVKRAKIGSAQSIFISTLGGAGVPQASSYFTSSDTIQIYDYTGSAYTFDLTTSQTFKDTSAWYHLIFVYDSAANSTSNRVRLYVNGTQITSFSSASYPSLNADCSAFNRAYAHYLSQANAQYFDGYIAEVNFVDGQALTPLSFGQFDANNNWMPQRYTGTYGNNGFYLPLSKPTNTDVMSFGVQMTAGSGQYLQTPSNAAFQFGTGDFTIEMFVYHTNSGTQTTYFGDGTPGPNAGVYLYRTTSNTFSVYTSSQLIDSTATVPVNQWVHVAVTRSGTSLRLFMDGKIVGSATNSTNFTDTGGVFIGNDTGGSGQFVGAISNVRVVKGTAVYTANFTPASSNLTAISGTSLLTCQAATIVDASTNAFTITNTGTVTVVDASPWQRTVGYDASGSNNNLYPVNFDYSVPRSTVLTYGTPGTYTWVAPAGVTSVKALVIAGGGAGGSNGGGGGAGGMIYNAAVSVTPGTSYTVTVGRGGHTRNQGNATNSVFSSLTAIAGGNGATYAVVAAQNGGSGGGGSLGTNTPGTGTAGQGNAGGAGNNGNSGNTYYHGGGGGAGGAGFAGGDSRGGPGLVNSITGVPIYYAGGGGSHYFITNTAYRAAGGIGGGGDGVGEKSGAAAGGRPNSGGGGGGTSAGLGGGPGGSGVVILSYTNAALYDGVGANSIIASDISRNTPTDFEDSTGVSGNYPILNYSNYSISNSNSGNTYNITNAGLTLMSDSSGAHKIVPATMPVSSGKWYFEMILESNAADAYSAMGLIPWPLPNHDYLTNLPSSTSTTNGFSWQSGSANNLVFWTDYINGASRYVTMNPITASAIGDVMQIAVDIDNNKIWAGRNNTWYDASGGSTGNPSTGANPTATNVSRYIGQYGALVPFCSVGQENMVTANFGQSGFMYTPPTGFKAINSKNLKDVGSYNLPDTFGNYVNSPDLVWIKNRTAASGGGFFNTVIGPTRFLQPTNTNGLATTSGELETFLPNGFQVGTNGNITNNSGNSYVAWNWNRGKTPGFDIVNYGGDGVNGRMIKHNLGVTPAFYITKCLTSYNNTQGFNDWSVYHQSCPTYTGNSRMGKQALWLHSILGAQNGVGGFFNTATSTEFSPNQINYDNSLGQSYIAYLWAEVPGFSKFGGYTGNNSNDGPFIYLGFRPRFILLKKIGEASTTYGWQIYDTARSPANLANLPGLWADTTAAEAPDTYAIDLVSNGFKIRTNNLNMNNTSTFIYAAWAESPFKYANAR